MARADSWPSRAARAAAENILRNEIDTGVGTAHVAGNKVVCLRDGQWMNDLVIDAWLTLVQQFSDRTANMPRIHIMHTAFYTRMTVAPNGSKCFDFPGVASYFKDKDLLLYEYIFFPINQSQNHWALVVINMHDKCIEYYDSLLLPKPKRLLRKAAEICEPILQWLYCNLAARPETIDLSTWRTCVHRRAPQQANFYDCGVYMCQITKWLAARTRGTHHPFPFSACDVAMLRVQMVHELSRGAIQPQRSTANEIQQGRLERSPRIGARVSLRIGGQASRGIAPSLRRYRGNEKVDLIQIALSGFDDELNLAARASVTKVIKACFADKTVTVKFPAGDAAGGHQVALVGFAGAEKPRVNTHIAALQSHFATGTIALCNWSRWTVSPALGTTKATAYQDVCADTSMPVRQCDRDRRQPAASPTAAQAAMAHHQQAGALAVEVYTAMLRARSDPIAFAAFLEDRIKCYKGMHYYPRHGGPAQITTEGPTAVYEAIQFLRALPRNRSVLRPDLSLHLAGADHCHDVGRTGHASHTGGDGSHHGTRQARYVAGATNTGECIWLGPVHQQTTGMAIVADWVIDDGVGSRSHRACIFDTVYTSVGIASGSHSSMGSIIVMALAAGHISRTTRTASRLAAGPPDITALPGVRTGVPRTRWNLGLCQSCEMPIEGGEVSATTMPDGTTHRHHMHCLVMLATGEPPPSGDDDVCAHGMAPLASTFHAAEHPQFPRAP